MAKYKITTQGDGKTYTVSAPDDWSMDQVQADFVKKLGAQKLQEVVHDPFRKTGQEFNAKEFEALPSWRKVSKSVAHGGAEAARGLGRTVGLVPEEDQVQRADRQAMEEQMAKATPGGRASQIYGNIGATAPVSLINPGGALANSVLQGTIGGMASGGNPLERAENAAGGGLLGGAITGGAQLLRKPLNYLASALPEGLGGGRAARRIVSEDVRKSLPPKLAEELRKAPAGQRPLMATGSQDLAALEAANRVNPTTRTQWSKTDIAENNAAAGRLRNMVEGNNLNQNVVDATAFRDANTLPIKDDAIAAGTEALTPKRGPYTTKGRDVGGEILKKVEGLNSYDKASNQVLKDVKAQLGDNPSFEQLSNIRHMLSTSGLADNAPVYQTMKHIDDAMNSVTPKWGEYLKEYENLSGGVNEEVAKRNIGSHFFDPASGGAVGPTLAGQPKISGDTLANALSEHGFNQTMNRPNISPELQSGLEDLIGQQRRGDMWRQVAAAPPTGGEETLAQAGAQMAAPGMVGRVIGMFTGGDNRARAMADLLRSSPELMQALTPPQGLPMGAGNIPRNALIDALRSGVALQGDQNAP